MFQIFLNSLISNLSPVFTKNVLRVSATFGSSEIMDSFSVRVILEKLSTLLFQNAFLSVILSVSILG